MPVPQSPPFPCSACGACCRRVDQAAAMVAEVEALRFPHRWDETGRCEHLLADNRCAVYATRPLLCNLEAFAAFTGIPRPEFFRRNAEACNRLMREDGMDASYLITQTQFT